MTTESKDIIRKVAELNPTYESYHGSSYCFFCGAYVENGEAHDSDCLWVYCKQVEIEKDTPAEK